MDGLFPQTNAPVYRHFSERFLHVTLIWGEIGASGTQQRTQYRLESDFEQERVERNGHLCHLCSTERSSE